MCVAIISHISNTITSCGNTIISGGGNLEVNKSHVCKLLLLNTHVNRFILPKDLEVELLKLYLVNLINNFKEIFEGNFKEIY